MKLYCLFTDWLTVHGLNYQKYKTKSDSFHLNISLKVLKRYEKQGAMIKEFNVLGFKSDELYIKSTGYYVKNLSLCDQQFSKNEEFKHKLYSEKTINNYFNSTVYLRESQQAQKRANNHPPQFLSTNNQISHHKQLLFLIEKLKLRMVEKGTVHSYIEEALDIPLESFVTNNAFDDNKNNGSSHEFAYWLNYVLDFYQEFNSNVLENKLSHYFERLHRIFVRKKMYYHDLIGSDQSIINVSGVILISKAFFRYSLITKDFRFANSGLFMIDFVKHLQLRNNGFIQNTYPIHKGNSKLKFPSWTINYFVEALILKKQILDEFKNCIAN